jgi:SAM-dependent methyltransferase
VTPPTPRPLASFPLEGDDWDGVIRYGPLVPDERALRLLGSLAGRRVLLLGAGAGQPAASLARAGARVIAVEPTAAGVELVRRHCAARGVSVDVQERDLAELAFVRADTIDLVVSVFALAAVANLTRVFRQVHRVLRSDGAIVASLPHPVLSMLEQDDHGSLHVARDHGDDRPLRWSLDADGGAPPLGGQQHVHTTESLVAALTRAGFRLDVLLEPMASGDGEPPTGGDGERAYWQPVMAHLPVALVIRARKVGV